jgi:Tol biopolymer transport system component
MRRPPRLVCRSLCGTYFVTVLVSVSIAAPSAPDLGTFSNHTDVGMVSRPSTISYDRSANVYTIGASGANMWAAKDDFGFVWKQVSGDVALAADVVLLGESKQGHRKAGLIFRQSLDANSVYVDVMLHGDGHAALQYRSAPGGPSRTIQCPVDNPKRMRLEKRGAEFTLSVAGPDGVISPSGASIRLKLEGSFYAGLAVCAHDNMAFESATFSRVELGAPSARTAARISGLEVIALASTDRRVVARAEGRMESPHFSPDGTELYFNHNGKIQRIALSGVGAPSVVKTGSLSRCNNDHGFSPDGTQLIVSDLTETGKSLMYLLPAGGGTPRKIPVADPAYWHGWSPDGKTITYGAGREGNYDVFTIALENGTETRLTTDAANDNGPDYSADGQWIYFHSNRTGHVQIWRMHADGSNQEQVTNDEYFNWFPHPSPDGKSLAILSSKTVPDTGHPPDGDYVLRVISTDGAPIREIAQFTGGQGSLNIPCWSRDSKYLAFATYELPHE